MPANLQSKYMYIIYLIIDSYCPWDMYTYGNADRYSDQQIYIVYQTDYNIVKIR